MKIMPTSLIAILVTGLFLFTAVQHFSVNSALAEAGAGFTVNNNGTSTHKGGDSVVAMELVLPTPALDTAVAGITLAATPGVFAFPAGWAMYGYDATVDGGQFAAGADWIGLDNGSTPGAYDATDTTIAGTPPAIGSILGTMSGFRPVSWTQLLINDGGVVGTWEAGFDMIWNDVDTSGYYNADKLTSILFGNPGTCMNTDIASFAVYEDSNANGIYDSGVDGQIAFNNSAPFIGTPMPATGYTYAASSGERTIFFVVTFVAAPTNGCTFTAKLPYTGGAPFAALFASGDNGPTDVDVNTTDTITIDTAAPTIASVFAVQQSGAAATVTTNVWYFYSGDNLRFRVTSNEALSDLKACVRSITGDDSSLTCTTQFATGTLNTDFIQTSTNVGGFTYEFNTPLATLAGGGTVTNPDGYPMNLAITDAAGNVTYSSGAADSFVAALNVDPKVIYTGTPSINNATTTDWSTITDYSNANVLFNANDGTNDVGSIAFTGLDLTSQATIGQLATLASYMVVKGNQGTGAIDISIDHTNLSIFNTGATITIRVPTAVRPGLVVRNTAGTIVGSVPNDEAGTPIIDGDTLGGFTWNAGTQTLTFTTTGFSSFGADQTAPTETITPANASTGVATTTPIVVTFSEKMDTSSFTYTLVPSPGGEAVTWSAGDTVATINHTAFANSTSYAFTVTAANDIVGNPSAGSASTFTTVAVVPPSGGGGGGAGGRAVITTPTEETTTEETPAESYEAPLVFSDVAGHWAEDYIYQAKEKGYIRGYEDETFRPNQNINRAEAAKLIAMWLNASIGEDVCAEGLFPDVNCSLWYGKYVAYLYNAGIIQGYPDGNFAPGNYINRAEALKMMLFAKALQDSSVADVINPFSDVSANQWFYNYVMVGYKLSIIQGYGDGTFGPGRNITRAEFTKIFVETLLNN